MKKTMFKFSATLVASVWLAAPAYGTSIVYDLVGTLPTQTYNYTVFNDSLSQPLSNFVIYFPELSSEDYSGYVLNSATMPDGWDVELFSFSEIQLGAYGDALVIVSGNEIPIGGSLSGFGITFEYTGSGTPGSQYFEVYDTSTYSLLDSGFTTPATQGVPETGASIVYALIAGAFLAGLGNSGFKQRNGALN